MKKNIVHGNLLKLNNHLPGAKEIIDEADDSDILPLSPLQVVLPLSLSYDFY